MPASTRGRHESGRGSGEVDLDRNRSAERVANRRAAGDLRVESLKLVLGGVRRDVDLDPNRFVAGVLALQPEERVQVEVSFERNLIVLDLDSGDRRVSGVSDRKTVAKRGEELLDRIGGAV